MNNFIMVNKKFFLIFLITIGYLSSLQGTEIGKKEILIVDFGMNARGLHIGSEFSKILNSEKHSSLLTESLMNELAKDPYFKKVEQLKIENLRSEGDSKPLIAELLKNEKAKESEYLVVIEIEQIELSKKKDKRIKPTTNDETADGEVEEFEELKGRYVVNLKIVDVNTAKVIYADKVSQMEVECINEDEKMTMESFFKNLEKNLLKQLKTRIFETIRPIKVARVYQGYAYLERGGIDMDASLKVGMKMGVFIPSRPSVDVKTGEIIGDMEYMIGELQIIEVLPKSLKVRIMKYSRPVEVGFICRRIFETENKKCSK